MTNLAQILIDHIMSADKAQYDPKVIVMRRETTIETIEQVAKLAGEQENE